MSLLDSVRRAAGRMLGGRGVDSITVPVMDGPLKPNNYLERVPRWAAVADADNAVATAGAVFLSSGHNLLRLTADGSHEVIKRFEAPISCLAVSPAGTIAVGLDNRGVRIIDGKHGSALIERIGATALNCPTAALFLDEDTLIVANGSSEFPAGQWQHDLLNRGTSGEIFRIELPSGKGQSLVSRLQFPAGLCRGDGGEIVVAEAWAHRLVTIPASRPGVATPVLDDLPAYPGRLCPAASGGFWLSCFATRSQLQEFVLREHRFRRQMMAEIPPEFWIAPTLSSGRSFKEPLQAGGIIHLGIHKPWAPTRSYGLVIRLDDAVQPVWSAHSRADGKRHGITSVAEFEGWLIATAKGNGDVVALPHVDLAEPEDLSIAELYA